MIFFFFLVDNHSTLLFALKHRFVLKENEITSREELALQKNWDFESGMDNIFLTDVWKKLHKLGEDLLLEIVASNWPKAHLLSIWLGLIS